MTARTQADNITIWQQERFGMFIHWGLYALPARHEWVRNHEHITTEDYQKYFDHFDPDLYDPTQWAAAARQAGMKYVVLTTKHHEGFCLWDTKLTEYKAPNTPAGRDLLTPFVEAFRAEGLRIGFYYSLIDWHHPHFRIDHIHPQGDGKKLEELEAMNKGREQARYAQYMRDQVTELLTQFGEIDMLWFDFSYPSSKDKNFIGKDHNDWESADLEALVRKLQPQIMINNRLDLPHEPDFVTPEQYQPFAPMTNDKGEPQIWEACQTFSGSWGYHRDEHSWKSVKVLLQMLIDSVSKNGNMLLNVGPTARGEFDARANERLAGIGQWMHWNSRSIYGCVAAPGDWQVPPDCRFTFNPATNRLYLHILSWPFKNIHLVDFGDKIDYAQFLHDGSEVRYSISAAKADDMPHDFVKGSVPPNTASLELPAEQPPVEIPVIELFLKS